MNIKKIVSKILVSIFFLGTAGNVFAIGMVTEPIVIENILRGGEIMKTVTMLNPEKNEVIYELGSGGDIEGWVRFFETDNLDEEITQAIVPAQEYYDVMAKIKVPDNTPNGDYEGEIFIKQVPKEDSEQEENTVAISQMVSRSVNITVSDKEVIKITTTLIPEKYDLGKGESLKVRIIYENFGNIALEPNMQVKVTDVNEEKTVFNAIFPYPEEESPVIPGERKEISVFEWQTTGQAEGKYKIEINTLINGEALEQDHFSFNIGNVAYFDKENKNNFLAAVSLIGGGNIILAWFIIGLAFVVLAIVINLFNKKKKLLKLNFKKIKSMFF